MRDAAGQHADRLQLRRAQDVRLQLRALRHVAQHQHHARRLALVVADRRAAALHQSAHALAMHQRRGGRQLHHQRVGQRALVRRGQRLARALVLQRAHLAQHAPDRHALVPAGELLRRLVQVVHHAVAVGRHHRLGHRAQGHAQALALARQIVLRGLARVDVRMRADEAHRPPVRVELRQPAREDPPMAPVATQQPLLHPVVRGLAREMQLHRPRRRRAIIRMHQRLPRLARLPEVALAVAEHLAAALRQKEAPGRELDLPDARVDAPHRELPAVLALAQPLLRVPQVAHVGEHRHHARIVRPRPLHRHRPLHDRVHRPPVGAVHHHVVHQLRAPVPERLQLRREHLPKIRLETPEVGPDVVHAREPAQGQRRPVHRHHLELVEQRPRRLRPVPQIRPDVPRALAPPLLQPRHRRAHVRHRHRHRRVVEKKL